jgi:hypothetical protein
MSEGVADQTDAGPRRYTAVLRTLYSIICLVLTACGQAAEPIYLEWNFPDGATSGWTSSSYVKDFSTVQRYLHGRGTGLGASFLSPAFDFAKSAHTTVRPRLRSDTGGQARLLWAPLTAESRTTASMRRGLRRDLPFENPDISRNSGR